MDGLEGRGLSLKAMIGCGPMARKPQLGGAILPPKWGPADGSGLRFAVDLRVGRIHFRFDCEREIVLRFDDHKQAIADAKDLHVGDTGRLNARDIFWPDMLMQGFVFSDQGRIVF